MSELPPPVIGDVSAAPEFRRGRSFVSQVFVPHPLLASLLKDEKDLLLGFKGSGKSWLFRVLLDYPDIVQSAYGGKLCKHPDGGPRSEYSSWCQRVGARIREAMSFSFTRKPKKRLRVDVDGERHEVIVAGLDLKSADADIEKARLEDTAESVLKEAGRQPETEVCTSRLRSEWLKVIARVALEQVHEWERNHYARVDYLYALLLLLPACSAASLWEYRRYLPWWAYVFLLGSLVSVYVLPPLVERFYRFCGCTVCGTRLIRHMAAAGIARSLKPLPLMWWLLVDIPVKVLGGAELLRGVLGLSWVLEKMQLKGIHISFFSATPEPTAILRDISTYLANAQVNHRTAGKTNDHRLSPVFMVFLVDNLEHVVDLKARDRARLLIEQFSTLLEGFQLCYPNIRIKALMRTDLAVSAQFSDRTQMACRFGHLRWEGKDAQEVLERRLKFYWKPGNVNALFGVLSASDAVAEAPEGLMGLRAALAIANSPPTAVSHPVWRLLDVYLRDALGSVEPRFIVRWADKAILWTSAKEAGQAEVVSASVTAASFAAGIGEVSRYVLDEMMNDYFYIWPRIRVMAERMEANGQCERADLREKLGTLLVTQERVQSKDGAQVNDADVRKEQIDEQGEDAIRQLHYHGLLRPLGNESIDSAESLQLPHLFWDALRGIRHRAGDEVQEGER